MSNKKSVGSGSGKNHSTQKTNNNNNTPSYKFTSKRTGKEYTVSPSKKKNESLTSPYKDKASRQGLFQHSNKDMFDRIAEFASQGRKNEAELKALKGQVNILKAKNKKPYEYTNAIKKIGEIGRKSSSDVTKLKAIDYLQRISAHRPKKVNEKSKFSPSDKETAIHNIAQIAINTGFDDVKFDAIEKLINPILVTTKEKDKYQGNIEVFKETIDETYPQQVIEKIVFSLSTIAQASKESKEVTKECIYQLERIAKMGRSSSAEVVFAPLKAIHQLSDLAYKSPSARSRTFTLSIKALLKVLSSSADKSLEAISFDKALFRIGNLLKILLRDAQKDKKNDKLAGAKDLALAMEFELRKPGYEEKFNQQKAIANKVLRTLDPQHPKLKITPKKEEKEEKKPKKRLEKRSVDKKESSSKRRTPPKSRKRIKTPKQNPQRTVTNTVKAPTKSRTKKSTAVKTQPLGKEEKAKVLHKAKTAILPEAPFLLQARRCKKLAQKKSTKAFVKTPGTTLPATGITSTSSALPSFKAAARQVLNILSPYAYFPAKAKRQTDPVAQTQKALKLQVAPPPMASATHHADPLLPTTVANFFTLDTAQEITDKAPTALNARKVVKLKYGIPVTIARARKTSKQQALSSKAKVATGPTQPISAPTDPTQATIPAKPVAIPVTPTAAYAPELKPSTISARRAYKAEQAIIAPLSTQNAQAMASATQHADPLLPTTVATLFTLDTAQEITDKAPTALNARKVIKLKHGSLVTIARAIRGYLPIISGTAAKLGGTIKFIMGLTQPISAPTDPTQATIPAKPVAIPVTPTAAYAPELKPSPFSARRAYKAEQAIIAPLSTQNAQAMASATHHADPLLPTTVATLFTLDTAREITDKAPTALNARKVIKLKHGSLVTIARAIREYRTAPSSKALAVVIPKILQSSLPNPSDKKAQKDLEDMKEPGGRRLLDIENKNDSEDESDTPPAVPGRDIPSTPITHPQPQPQPTPKPKPLPKPPTPKTRQRSSSMPGMRQLNNRKTKKIKPVAPATDKTPKKITQRKVNLIGGWYTWYNKKVGGRFIFGKIAGSDPDSAEIISEYKSAIVNTLETRHHYGGVKREVWRGFVEVIDDAYLYLDKESDRYVWKTIVDEDGNLEPEAKAFLDSLVARAEEWVHEYNKDKDNPNTEIGAMYQNIGGGSDKRAFDKFFTTSSRKKVFAEYVKQKKAEGLFVTDATPKRAKLKHHIRTNYEQSKNLLDRRIGQEFWIHTEQQFRRENTKDSSIRKNKDLTDDFIEQIFARLKLYEILKKELDASEEERENEAISTKGKKTYLSETEDLPELSDEETELVNQFKENPEGNLVAKMYQDLGGKDGVGKKQEWRLLFQSLFENTRDDVFSFEKLIEDLKGVSKKSPMGGQMPLEVNEVDDDGETLSRNFFMVKASPSYLAYEDGKLAKKFDTPVENITKMREAGTLNDYVANLNEKAKERARQSKEQLQALGEELAGFDVDDYTSGTDTEEEEERIERLQKKKKKKKTQ